MDAQTSTHGRIAVTVAEGAAAGVAAGAVLGLLMAVFHPAGEHWVALKIAAYPFLGDRVLEPGFDALAVALGVGTHVAISVFWGVLFGSIAHGIGRAATVWAGAFWGVVVWLCMFGLVLPRLGGHLAQGGGTPGVLLAHLIFGVVLGAAFLQFQTLEAHRPSGPVLAHASRGG
jgi:hypothetical protein